MLTDFNKELMCYSTLYQKWLRKQILTDELRRKDGDTVKEYSIDDLGMKSRRTANPQPGRGRKKMEKMAEDIFVVYHSREIIQ